ncbi:unnamed protein product, partial [Ectocarpus sp. 8 AP-2014]
LLNTIATHTHVPPYLSLPVRHLLSTHLFFAWHFELSSKNLQLTPGLKLKRVGQRKPPFLVEVAPRPPSRSLRYKQDHGLYLVEPAQIYTCEKRCFNRGAEVH